jgi:hypothetical protein
MALGYRLLGVGWPGEAGFRFRVNDDAFVSPGGLLQLVEAHVQAGQEKISLLLSGIQPEGFFGVSQGLLHIALALVEGGQLHLQERRFGIIFDGRLIFLDGPGLVIGHQ